MYSDEWDALRDIRWERKYQRFGTPDAQCAKCRNADIRVLCEAGAPEEYPALTLCKNDLLRRLPWTETLRINKLRKFAEAGYTDPRCVHCQEADLRVLELNHIAAAANSGLVAPECGNCHMIFSDCQEDLTGLLGVDLRRRDPGRRHLARLAAFQVGVALFLFLLADTQCGSTKTALGFIIAGLIAWAVWLIAADHYFAATYGPDYSKGVPAPVPT